jgi:hypothetical protein
MCDSKEPQERHHHGTQPHVREFAARLQAYFNKEPDLLDWIQDSPLFIYVALYECFNSFATILHQYERVYHDVVSVSAALGR